MSNKRYAAKRDGNEDEIKTALRAAGCQVYALNEENIPDLLVGYRGETVLIEVKTRKGKLSDGQRAFFEDWRGGRLLVARSADEALRALGLID